MRSREDLGEIERGMGNNTEGARDMGNSENEESGRKMRSSEEWGERDDCRASLSPKACSYVHMLLCNRHRF